MFQTSSILIALLLAFFGTFSTHAWAQDPAPAAPTTASAPVASPSTSTLSPEDQEILDRGPISDGQYLGGGLVATFVGLGIGQAIEGRYLPYGLVFTLGELASTGLIVAGAMDCVTTDIFGINHVNDSCHNSAFTAGIIGLLVFRIWEIGDAWIAPPSINRRYEAAKARAGEAQNLHFFAVPVLAENVGSITGGELGLQFRF